jgi:hypothetical protein
VDGKRWTEVLPRTMTFGRQRRARCTASLDQGRHQRDLQGQGSTPAKRRRRGVVGNHRISAFLPAGMTNSGEEFVPTGGVSGSESGGAIERRSGGR